MSICINKMQAWLDKHAKIKQWAWFVLLWLGGLVGVMCFAYPIKWIIKSM